MPIRPENAKRYPPDWTEISLRIRFERALGRCECTGECGLNHRAENIRFHASGAPVEEGDERCFADHNWPHPVTGAKVILTVAHLPGREIEQCSDADLKAMCQRCHNRMDMPARRRGIWERARALLAIGDLFS